MAKRKRKRKKRRKKPSPWDTRDPVPVAARIRKYVRPGDQVAIGIDPGIRGIGIVVCKLHTGKLLCAEAFPLPKGKENIFKALQALLALPHPALKMIAIEAQPGIAKRSVVRVEAYCYAIAMALAANPVYVQPKRKAEEFILKPNDQRKIGKLPKDLQEHAISALFMVRKALEGK